MHPYTKRILGLLGDRDPMAILAASPARVEELYGKLSRSGLDHSYGPGKWSAAQILCHMADTEVAVGFRVRQALAEDNHRIQAFEQDDWARRYKSLDPALAVRSYGALREWNLNLFRTLTPQDRARVAQHPERGEESVDIILRLLAGHDLNHIAQLEQVQAAASR